MRAVLVLTLLMLLALCAQAQELKRRADTTPQQPDVMVDEDEDLLPQTTYAFNPIQAKKEHKIGTFYQKKGNERAAAARYLEATRWHPSFGDAYWRLAEMREALEQPAEALDAYRRFVRVEPEDSKVSKARKRIAEIEAALAKESAVEDSNR